MHAVNLTTARTLEKEAARSHGPYDIDVERTVMHDGLVLNKFQPPPLGLRHGSQRMRVRAAKAIAEACVASSISHENDGGGHRDRYDTLLAGVPHEGTIGCPARNARALV